MGPAGSISGSRLQHTDQIPREGTGFKSGLRQFLALHQLCRLSSLQARVGTDTKPDFLQASRIGSWV
jgi:hypothetical protein